MNLKTVLVALGSAVFAAGLTYWVVSPIQSGDRSVAAAKMVPPTPAGPPLVISKAGPDPVVVLPPTPAPAAAQNPPPVAQPPVEKPSPVGEPIAPPPAVATDPAPALPEKAPEPVVSAPPPTVEAPPSPVRPAPPERVALYPPKEIDRAQPVTIRDPETSGGPNTTTIAEGSLIVVRLGESLSSQKNLTGDTFFASLDQPLVAGGFVIAEKGARVEGKIVEVDKAKGIGGSSRMSLELTQVNTSDGQRVHVQTSVFNRDGGERNRDHDAAKVGGGAILGAVIGAAAGGGKGAAIGAGAGAAAGGGAVLLSGGRTINIPVETKLTFRIVRPITITERVVQ